jgi:hypothetical protein
MADQVLVVFDGDSTESEWSAGGQTMCIVADADP